MKKKHWLLCFINFVICGTFLCSQVWCEEGDITVLDSVIVTSSGTKTKLLNTNGSIHVLTEKDIKNSGQNKITGLISSIPGVINHKSGSKTYFSIRGTRTGMSAGPAIYLDGRPLNVGVHGYSKIDTISVDNIKQIEVIKSPPASKYGANSARGVILITTKRGDSAQDMFNGSVSAEYGSWDTLDISAGVLGNMQKFDYSIFASSMKTDGYRESDNTAESVDAQAGYKFDGGKLDLFIGVNTSFTKYPIGLPEWQVDRDRTVGDANTKEDGSGHLYLQNETDEEFFNTQIKFDYDKNNWLFNTAFIFSRDNQVYTRMADFNHTDINKKRDDYRDDRVEEQYDFKINGGRILNFDNTAISDTITLGLDYKYADFDQEREYPFNTTPMSTNMISDKDKADIDATRKLLGINLDNDFSFHNFRLQTGIRLNNVTYKLENQVPDSIKIDRKDDLDWSISPSYSIFENANLFVTWNRSHYYLPLGYYKSNMQYDHPEAQAEDLKPEIYHTIETGYRHQYSKAFNYSIMYYHTKVKDKLVSFYDAAKFKGYRNAGTSIHQGIEAEIDGRPLQWFGYRISFATIDAEWDEGIAKAYATPDAKKTSLTDLKGNKVHYVPEYEYAIGVDFYPFQETSFGSLTISLDYHGFGEQYEDYNNNLKMPNAEFFDMKASWVFKQFECYLVCSNLFDKEWDKAVNSLGKSHERFTAGPRALYPQDGRYIGLGVTYRF